MIIDCHIHLWDRHCGETLSPAGYGRFVRADGRSWQMLPVAFEDCRSPVEYALGHMDWLGIDRAVVVQEWLDGRQDDYLAGLAPAHRRRLSLFGLLDCREPSRLPGYVTRVREVLGFDGVKLTAAHAEMAPLDGAAMMRVWEACAAHRLPVVAHLPRGAALAGPVDRVVTALPELTFVVAHLGLPPHPGWKEQAVLARHPNVFLDASGLTALFAEDGYPFPGAQAAIREALDIVGPGKIMWGSDYPRCNVDVSYKEILDLFRRECAFLDADERAAVLGGTAARVYRFGRT